MLVACWSAKGGSGTSVVAAALAVLLARSSPSGALLVDLAGDAAAVLGLPEPPGPGVAAWLAAGPDVPPEALARLEVDAGAGVRLLAPGAGPPPAGVPLGERVEALVDALLGEPRPVVADCGTLAFAGPGAAPALAAGASQSLLVLRPCYLGLRRALAAPLRPSAVVLVREPGRALGAADVEAILGVPVRAEIDLDPAVARAVDAGLLAARLPRGLERALRVAA